MKAIPIDAQRLTLTVAAPPRRQSKPNTLTGEHDWNVPLLALWGDRAEIMPTTVPDSGMPANLGALAPVDADELIARLWEKQDGRHGAMFSAEALHPRSVNGSTSKTTGAAA
jgi:hypothetical protein